MAAWDSVPWMVGGGALHSPEVGRLLAYAATSGSEGVVGIGDLAVRALAVPGASIRVAPGGAVIRNRSTGGSQQTYVGRLISEDVVGIASTGSSSGRSDMVIARVEDPFVAGTPWQDPPDPTVGPYVFTRVIPNVPASAIASPDAARRYLTALGYSAIPLAGVTLPASTGTVTSAMIKPLREMANPRRKRDVSTVALTTAQAETLVSQSAGGEPWPNAAAAKWGGIEIPEWASQVRIVGTWAQVKVPPGNIVGYLWVHVGPYDGGTSVDTQAVTYDTPGLTNSSRATFVVGDTINIPKALRGTVQMIRPTGRIGTSNPVASSRLVLDGGSAVILDLEFLEAPAEDDS